MTTTPSQELTLCCLLWANPGLEVELTSYEDAVLALVSDHGASVLERVVGPGTDGYPAEVQVYSFPTRAAMDSYLADPRRLALSDERDRVISRTELFPVIRR